jgi:hypothetical protein
MGTAITRRRKVEWLKDAILSFFNKKPQGKISKDKLIAEFCIAQNSTIRTGEELLLLLKNTGLIKIKGDDIYK